jgi:hypothetical protein
MNPAKKNFKSGPFKSRQFGWCDLRREHTSAHGVTQGLTRARPVT